MFEGDSSEELFYNNKHMICSKPDFEISNLSNESYTLMS